MSCRLRARHDWSDRSEWLVLHESPVARSAFFYVQEIGHFYARRHYFTERERLDSFLLGVTLAGSGMLQFRDRTFMLRPGQAFFIHCMEYQMYASAADVWELLWLHFNGGTSGGYWELFCADGDPVVKLPADAQVIHQMQKIIERNRRPAGKRDEAANSLVIVEILTELLTTKFDRTSSEGRAPVPAHVARAIAALDERYVEKWTLERLAAECCVSKFYLSREFKRHSGRSPMEYLLQIRLAAARRLLGHSALSVAEIAAAVGMDHASHFISLFKREMRMTPLAFRRAQREKLPTV